MPKLLRLLLLFAAACHGAPAAQGVPAKRAAIEIASPFPVDALSTLAGRYRFADGSLRLQLDGQDLARTPIRLRGATKLPSGSYDLYVRVHDDDGGPGPRELEVGLGDALAPLSYDVPTGDAWIGPIRLEPRTATATIDMRGTGEVRLSEAWLARAGTRPGARVSPVVKNVIRRPLQTVWIDLPDAARDVPWFARDTPIAVRVRSSPARGASARVTCRVLDVERREVARHAFAVPLSGILHEEIVPVPQRFGPYLLQCEVELQASRSTFQLVVARISEPLDVSSDLLGAHAQGPLPKALGAGWIRKWDAGGTELLWRNVEPKQGVFSVPASLPSSLRQLAVLEGPPDWAAGTDGGAWLDYVRKVVRARRADIDAWEVFNEPYNKPEQPWIDDHVTRVAATARVIRAEDPGALVVTGGPPREVASGLAWWKALASAGLFAAVDVVSVHMYFGRGGMHPLDTDRDFHEYAKQLRTLVDAHGGAGKPIWDTESGIGPNETFYLGRDVRYGYWDTRGFHSYEPVAYEVGVAMAARLLMLHIWHRMPWFHYHGAPSYGNHLALVDFDGSPLPLAVALAQVARHLDGAIPAGELTLPDGLWGLRFRTGGRAIAVLWAVGVNPATKRAVRVAPADVRWHDVFGNPSATAPTQLGIAPIYITGSSADVDRVIASVRL